MGYMISGMY